MAPKKPDSPIQTSPITADQVLAYLENHPNFLIKHPELIESLTPPNRHSENRVVDLQNFMLRKLQHDNAQLRGVNSGLIHHSRENLTAQQRVHSAVISILSAISLEDLLHIVTSDLVMHLGIDVVSLCFEANDLLQVGTVQHGMQILDPFLVDEIMGSRGILMRSDIDGDPAIFGAGAGMVRSDALIRLYLSDTTPDGLLALGSRAIDAFHPVFGGELLGFLGQVIEISMRQWLDIAE